MAGLNRPKSRYRRVVAGQNRRKYMDFQCKLSKKNVRFFYTLFENEKRGN
jgi:hypothetical protein